MRYKEWGHFEHLSQGGGDMIERRCSGVDRRIIRDRRRACNFSRLFYRGRERRSCKERRLHVERRVGWVRMSKWSSVFLEDLKIARFLS
jgi:hypothetical protein